MTGFLAVTVWCLFLYAMHQRSERKAAQAKCASLQEEYEVLDDSWWSLYAVVEGQQVAQVEDEWPEYIEG